MGAPVGWAKLRLKRQRTTSQDNNSNRKAFTMITTKFLSPQLVNEWGGEHKTHRQKWETRELFTLLMSYDGSLRQSGEESFCKDVRTFPFALEQQHWNHKIEISAHPYTPTSSSPSSQPGLLKIGTINRVESCLLWKFILSLLLSTGEH